jgi:prophage antirepressor-like protein
MTEEIKEDNNCIVKAFENNPISIVTEDINSKKIYYFKASDIGKALGIVNIRSTIQNYDDDERVVRNVYDPQGTPQDTIFLSSQGVYRLLYNSKKEVAKKFRKWAGNILDDIIFNESVELKKQLKQNEMILLEQKNLIKQLENKPETEGFITTEGFIYLVKDTYKFGHYKIGLSEDPNKRLIGLNVGSSTNSLEIVNTYKTKNSNFAEQIIHKALNSHKIKKQKEWFYITNDILLDFTIKTIKECIDFTDKYTYNNVDEQINYLHQKEHNIKNDKENYVKMSNKEIQTDIEAINQINLETEDKDENIFNKFLTESCVFDDLVYCSKRELIYQYKTWSKINNIFNYKDFEQYLLSKFKSKKMLNEMLNTEMSCVIGINLKDSFYKFDFKEPLTEFQQFLVESCVKLPTAKLNRSTIKNTYEKWCERYEKDTPNKNKVDSLYKFLDKYFFKDKFYEGDSSYFGWYGVSIKENILKGTGINSTLCKKNKVFKVYKDDPKKVIKQWNSQKDCCKDLGMGTSTIKYRIDNKHMFVENNKEFYLIRENDFN